ncbi:MAG: isocitrate lyase/phosphoenolpyruvate mutase family protein [Bacteroidota bacterium]|nr:isocitrate lyase/phosphoenolpyruvate mutase family protein [Bacteroidota bacterium]MDP4215505.1 isocitrate lyase/phosphoenolpyruvate mutase family protein [Bacteroidota bacterium]MDP4246322.1 isocitrate lyase/phosphoenolpyruvate mutase family protein [Bacteroidota bacterium]MDP4253086.1 isocitrate lyase/phosphoenolpyruvate mutase family protein [Bacteroidota bacterium]MDP4259809.1 isocitrate lyase/phosphoenolpyruvate mutase family protein [Bacteroidota bacterium]
MPTDHARFARALAFKALHERAGLFIIPNPWDAGSAKLLTGLGFEALATTSAGLAYSLGKADGQVTREELLQHARSITSVTHLPVAADLEGGFGDDPAICAETILKAAETGLVGGSIEDASRDPANPIYPLPFSVERVKAAVAAARSLPFPFTLTARAENYLHGRADLQDTILRLKAFAEAGADVLFAPGLRTRQEIESAVNAVRPKPLNVIMAFPGADLTLDELAGLGVKRVSLGSSLARAAYGAFFRAAEEVRQQGSFTYASSTIPFAEINTLLRNR